MIRVEVGGCVDTNSLKTAENLIENTVAKVKPKGIYGKISPDWINF